MTAEERKSLEDRAGGLPVSTYIKRQLFSDDRRAASQFRRVARDQELLGRLLAQLGASELPRSLKIVADAAADDALAVDDLLRARLHDACTEVRNMHDLLLAALSGEPLPPSPTREGAKLPPAQNLLSEQFNKLVSGR